MAHMSCTSLLTLATVDGVEVAVDVDFLEARTPSSDKLEASLNTGLTANSFLGVVISYYKGNTW